MTTNQRRDMLSGDKIKKIKYDYGRKNTLYVEAPDVDESRLPKEGDILFYKKRGIKEKRLNQINQWKFICVETEGKKKGKWKVQGLHRKEGDYCWFDPKMLRNSKEILNDPVMKATKEMNNARTHKPLKVSNKDRIRALMNKGLNQREIGERIGISASAVCQHIRLINSESDKITDPIISKSILESEMPILNLTETAQYLRIGKTRLREVMNMEGIKPQITGTGNKLTESQIEKIAKRLEKQEKEKKNQRLRKKKSLKDYPLKKVNYQKEKPSITETTNSETEKINKEIKEILKPDNDLAFTDIDEISTYGLDFPVSTNDVFPEEPEQELLDPNQVYHSLGSTIQELGIGKLKLYEYLDELNINPISSGRSKIITESQLEMIRSALKRNEPTIQQPANVHQATKDLKLENYKMIIKENLKMIKSLVNQTNELLEKM